MSKAAYLLAAALGLAAYLVIGWLLVFGAGQLGYYALQQLGADASMNRPSIAQLGGAIASILSLIFYLAITSLACILNGVKPLKFGKTQEPES